MLFLKCKINTDFDELLEGQLAVHVLVHLPEDLVRPLLRRGLVLRHLHDRPNLQHASQRSDLNLTRYRYSWHLSSITMSPL